LLILAWAYGGLIWTVAVLQSMNFRTLLFTKVVRCLLFVHGVGDISTTLRISDLIFAYGNVFAQRSQANSLAAKQREASGFDSLEMRLEDVVEEFKRWT
jgi:hypothetical protein